MDSAPLLFLSTAWAVAFGTVYLVAAYWPTKREREAVDNRTRAREWMLGRCASELTGNRMGQSDVEDASTDTESGKPCDCLDSLTAEFAAVRREALEEAAQECDTMAEACALAGTPSKLIAEARQWAAQSCASEIRALATPTKPKDDEDH